MGRKKLDCNAGRSHDVICAKVNQTEKTVIRNLAKAKGVSVSKLVRDFVLSAAAKKLLEAADESADEPA